MKKYRVLQVIPLMHVGGTELSAKSLSVALAARGHCVSVIANEGPLFSEFRDAGLTMIRGDIHLRSLSGLLRGASSIRRYVLEEGTDVVHFHNAFSALMGPLAAGLLHRKCKVIWHCRGLHWYTYPIMARLANHCVDMTIANCFHERDRLIGYGLSPRRVQAVYNIPNIAIPASVPPRDARLTHELGIKTEEAVVAGIGNFYPDRGVHYFLDAARRVLSVRQDVRFLVVGDGPMKAELRAYAARHDLTRKVHFLGTRRDVEAIYSVTDVLVNPVLSGAGTGNVTAEAMAFAKPVVATDVGGLPELVRHMETGVLVPPRDGLAIADAVVSLLGDRDLARRLGQAGRERILSDFTPDRIATAVEDIYTRILGDGA